MQAISYQTFTFIMSCDSIMNFLANSYFIEQIHHAKSFKTKYNLSISHFFIEIFTKMLKRLVRNSLHQTLLYMYVVFVIFQWDSSDYAGFTNCSKSKAGEPCPWLPVADDYKIYNVKNQEHSLLETFRNISKLRDMEAFKSGEVYFPFHDEEIFSFLR